MPDQVTKPKQRIACRFFASAGGCRRGDACYFLHEGDGSPGVAKVATDTSITLQELDAVLPSRSERPCKWFLAGWCRRGNDCWFSHDPAHLDSGVSAGGSAVAPGTAPQAESSIAGSADGTRADSEGTKDAGDAEDTECSICTEPFKGLFGLLPNCTHAFCLTCVRKWRAKKENGQPGNKSCPVCRASSDFIIPANKHLKGEDKDRAMAKYRSNMASIPCRHFEKAKEFGRLDCSFGDDCFYAHVYGGKPYKFGAGAAEMRQRRMSRRARTTRRSFLSHLQDREIRRVLDALDYGSDDDDDDDDDDDYDDDYDDWDDSEDDDYDEDAVLWFY